MTTSLILAVVVLIAVVMAARMRRGGGTPNRKLLCKWERAGEATGRLQEYRCTTCDVTAYSGTGSPPRDCKRGLGAGAL